METLPGLIRRSLEKKRERVLLERSNGAWRATGSDELLQRIENLACAIRDAGLSGGDRVALIAADSVDWIVVDFAILFAGCVVVPIFPTQAADQVGYILSNSQAKLLFADTYDALHRLTQAKIALPPSIVFQSARSDSLAQFEKRGSAVRADHPQWPREWESGCRPDDMAVLIYTSGTTGEPKGVMLSHHNLAFTAQSSFGTAFTVLREGSDVLSVLPFSHIYEHCIVYGYLLTRVQHYICHHVDELLSDMQSVRPVAMTLVPRIFERLIAGVTARAKTHGGLQARLVPWALRAGRRYMTARVMQPRVALPARLQYAVAQRVVLKKVRKRLGLDRVKFLVSGSAPLHVDTAMTMLGLGVTIIEGYGPTECSPVVTVNTYENNHYGTVGRPIPGVEIRVADDGEILVRGPNVMLGYYGNESATEQVMEGGWYHTGDIGEIDAEGFLRITDRKKELFKTSGGKFIAPARVESAIKRSVYVNQVMLVGDSRAHPAALISPNWDLLRAHLRIDSAVPARDLAQRSDVHDFLAKEVHEHTVDLARFEQVRKIAILPEEPSIESGELSPTLKMKRRVMEAKYAAQIERLFQ